MKLKAFVAAGLVVSASCAMAVVTSSNTLCRIQVESSSTETILAVPLIEIGGSDQVITITNLVTTTGLVAGDSLMYNDGDNWYSWHVNESGNWEAIATTVGGRTTKSPTSAQFARGRGVWLVRGAASKNNPIYLYGQCDARTTTTTFAAGTKARPQYTLMGNPKEAAFAPNSKTWTGCGQGDKIAYADANGKAQTFTYRTGKGWCEAVDTTGEGDFDWVTTSNTIPAGQGFWYVSVGGSGSVEW